VVSAMAVGTVQEVMATVVEVEADMAPVGCMEVGLVVATREEAGWAMRMVEGEAAMGAAAMAAAAKAVVAMAMAGVAMAMAAVAREVAAKMVVSAKAVGTAQEVMATVEVVEADMAPVGGMEVGSVMAKHLEAGWAVLMVVEVAMVVPAMVVAMVQEALAMAAAVEADAVRVGCMELAAVMVRGMAAVVAT
jgi:hypothetical protein